MLFDEPDTHQTPPTPPRLSPPRRYSPRSPSCSPPASFPSRESSVEPSSEDSSPKGRKRHQSEPAFIWPHDVDQGLSHGLSALLAEMSPLAPYRLQWQSKAKAQEKITTHKWLLSRPFGTNMVNWLISRPLCVYKQNWLLSRPSEAYTVDNRPPWTVLTSFKTIIHTVHKLPWTVLLLSRPFGGDKCGLTSK